MQYAVLVVVGVSVRPRGAQYIETKCSDILVYPYYFSRL